MKPVLLVPVYDVLVLQLIRILPDVLTARKSITGLDVIESEETVVLVAHMIHSEVDRRAIGCSGEHHIDHNARDVDFILAGQWVPHTAFKINLVIYLKKNIYSLKKIHKFKILYSVKIALYIVTKRFACALL